MYIYRAPVSGSLYCNRVSRWVWPYCAVTLKATMNLQKEAAEGFGRIAAQLPGAHAPPAIKVCQDHTTDRVVNTCVFVGQACIEKALCASYCWPAR